jgi:hypothetical protein
LPDRRSASTRIHRRLRAAQTKAADVTGKWTGTFTKSTGQADSAYFDLKQKGTELTGTAGPSAEQQMAISNGKVTDVKGVTTLTFEAGQQGGPVIKFNLKLVDGHLKGGATAEANGEKREATVDAARVK